MYGALEHNSAISPTVYETCRRHMEHDVYIFPAETTERSGGEGVVTEKAPNNITFLYPIKKKWCCE